MTTIRVRVLRRFIIAGGQAAEVGDQVDLPAAVAGEALRTCKAVLVDASDAKRLHAEVEKDGADTVRRLGPAPRGIRG
ncbi:MAG: hypothetical protein ING41_10480 [Burkholderiales bacterium]|nr:hypothetical protein [Burkholderiales bacterium]